MIINEAEINDTSFRCNAAEKEMKNIIRTVGSDIFIIILEKFELITQKLGNLSVFAGFDRSWFSHSNFIRNQVSCIGSVEIFSYSKLSLGNA